MDLSAAVDAVGVEPRPRPKLVRATVGVETPALEAAAVIEAIPAPG